MFAPINARRTNAIQWSMDCMIELKFTPRRYPSNGINAWKKPNHMPAVNMFLNPTLPVAKPLHMATAKASMLNPTAIRNSSIRLIYSSLSWRSLRTEEDETLHLESSRFQASLVIYSRPGQSQHVDHGSAVRFRQPTTPLSDIAFASMLVISASGQ